MIEARTRPGPVAMLTGALSLRVPLRFLRGGAARLALTVMALACGVGLVCAIEIVNRAVLTAFVEVVDAMAGRAALQVSAGPGGLFPEETVATVARVPGIEVVVPVVAATAFTTDGTGEALAVHGVDVTSEAAVRVYEGQADTEVDDLLVLLSRPDSIILTRAFARARGLSVDERIELATPEGKRAFTVRGLLEPKGVARVYGGNLAVMDILAAEAVFTRPGFVNRLDVVVNPDVDTDGVAAAIARELAPGLQVSATAQRKADIQRVVRSLQVVLRGVALMGLVAAFLIAFNRLATVFEGRSWQLGLMRAVGARGRVVWRELLKESLLLGAAGVALGIPLGIGLARLLLPVVATTTALNYKLAAPAAELTLSAPAFAVAAGLGLVVAVLAAALPARRAAETALAETMRNRGLEQREVAGVTMWAVRAGVGLCVILAAMTQAATGEAAWGLAATVLGAVAIALAARPLVMVVRGPITMVLGFLPRATGRFAAGTMSHRPRGAALTVAMIGVGIGTTVWLGTLAHSFEASVVSALGHAFRADLILSSSYIASGFDDAPMDGAVMREVEDMPGVAAVAGERLIDWHHAGGPIAIDAFDATYFARSEFGRWPLLGSHEPHLWEDLVGGRAVIVSTSFARNMSVEVGDEIVLDTPGGPLAVRVGGLTSAFASARGTVEMERGLYRRMWRDDQVTRVHLDLEPTADERTVRGLIAQRFGDRFRMRILSAGELLEYWTEQVRRAFAGVQVLGGLILVVILVGMADILAAGVVERRRELGAVRAVGGRRGLLARMVVTEALVLGALGLMLAVPAGLVLGVLWVEVTLPLLLGWSLELHVPYLAIAGAGLLALVVCLAAAVVPARQAARLEPVAALRWE